MNEERLTKDKMEIYRELSLCVSLTPVLLSIEQLCLVLLQKVRRSFCFCPLFYEKRVGAVGWAMDFLTLVGGSSGKVVCVKGS